MNYGIYAIFYYLFSIFFFLLQSEQKRFLQQHKVRSESYSKAAAAIKKQRKKTRTSAGSKAVMAMDKELKVKLFII